MSDKKTLIEASATGVVAGRDAKLRGRYVAGRDLYIHEGAATLRLPYQHSIRQLITFHTQRFVGRESELLWLIGFGTDPEPGYLLIEAPAGYGKSALAARFLYGCETGQWDQRPTVDLIVFFIRQDGNRNTPGAFCLAVNSQLLDLLELPGGVPADLNSQQGQLVQLWAMAAEAACAERPLLLLVDGLDEMMPGEVTICDLLPGELNPYVHVVVSSRPNPKPLAQVPLEHPLHQGAIMRLATLRLAEIEQLLRMQARPPEPAAHLAQRVLKVTRGEPLFARFVCQDIGVGDQQSLARLEHDRPRGVKDYFRRQFKLLDDRASGDTTWQVLGLLLVVHGAISIQELAAVLDLPMRHVRMAIEPIQRFLLGDERLELMHQELRAVIAEQFSATERQVYRHKIRTWCSSFEATGWLDDTPDYVLTCYAAHLWEADDREALYGLMKSRRWMELKGARTLSHRSFAQDVLLAIKAARSEEPPRLVQQICGSYIYATLTSSVTRIPPEVFGALTRMGQSRTAEDYASLVLDPGRRNAAYLQIAAALIRRGNVPEAKEAVRQALASARMIRDNEERVGALLDVASKFHETGEPDQNKVTIERAFEAAQAIPNDIVRVEALTSIAWRLIEDGKRDWGVSVCEVAFESAPTISDNEDSDLILSGLAVAFIQSGQADRALAVSETLRNGAMKYSVRGMAGEWAESELDELDWLLETADPSLALLLALLKDSPNGPFKSGLLTAFLSERVRAGHADEALASVEIIADEFAKAEGMAAIAEGLVDAGDPDQAVTVAELALRSVQSIHDDDDRAQVLLRVVSVLAKARHTDQAMALIKTIKDDVGKAKGLVAVAHGLVDAGAPDHALTVVDQALIAAHASPQDELKFSALTVIAAALVNTNQTDRALTLAEAITDDITRVKTLSIIAKELVDAGAPDQALTVVDQALIAAQAIPDGAMKGSALTVVAKELVRTNQVDRALRLAEAITDDITRVKALTHVAEGLVDTGTPDQALILLQQALKLTQTIRDDAAKADTLTSIAWALVEAGSSDQAVAVAELALQAAQVISDEESNTWALADIAAVLAYAGQTSRSLALADTIQDAEDKIMVLATVVELGHTGQAASFVECALQTAEMIDDEEDKAFALAQMARALTRTGQEAQALALAEMIESDEEKARALAAMAKALANEQRTNEAVSLAGQVLELARLNGYVCFFNIYECMVSMVVASGENCSLWDIVQVLLDF